MYVAQWVCDPFGFVGVEGVVAKVENPEDVDASLIGTKMYGVDGEDMGECRVNHRCWKNPPKAWVEKGKGGWQGHVARYDGDVFRIVYAPPRCRGSVV